MIISLRNRHLFIWVALAILLPIGFSLAYFAIPEKSPGRLVIPEVLPAMGQILSSHESDELLIRVLGNASETQKQLEFTLKESLSSPSSFIYLCASGKSEQLDQCRALGRLKSKGVYRFELKENSKEFELVIFDMIKKVQRDKISIQL